jgi:predicted DNA-binding transcriptional regulator AlpA
MTSRLEQVERVLNRERLPDSAKRRFLSLSAVARLYGHSKATIARMIAEGDLPARRIVKGRGGKPGWRIRPEDAERELAEPDNLPSTGRP